MVRITVVALRATKAGIALSRLVASHPDADVRAAAAESRAMLAAQLSEKVGAVNARLQTREAVSGIANAAADPTLEPRAKLLKHLALPYPAIPCITTISSFEFDDKVGFEKRRRTRLKPAKAASHKGPIIYWMSRGEKRACHVSTILSERGIFNCFKMGVALHLRMVLRRLQINDCWITGPSCRHRHTPLSALLASWW